MFLSTPADIAIYGGAAGGGKTFGILLEALRHINNPEFKAIIFRRTTVQIRNPGGLWDESESLYPLIGGVGTSTYLEWVFPSGATIKMAHLEHDKTRLEYQGSQIPLIVFDELCHFSESQFFYMLSRNRSMSGVRGYIRATCNPDPDSWVATFISWWIDQETGFPIKERAGVLRWFVRIGDEMHWADTAQELLAKFADLPPEDVQPKSVTFIPALLEDNPLMMRKDPGYKANLLAMPLVERAQLLGGNWKIKPSAGLLFKRGWITIVDAIPAGVEGWCRGWDLASTPKTLTNNPDWTAGHLMGVGSHHGERFYISADHTRLQETPGGVRKHLKATAGTEGPRIGRTAALWDCRRVEISLPKDPGQAGNWQTQDMIDDLAGYTVRATPESGDKVTRFGPYSSQAEAGRALVLRGDWNEVWLSSLERFDGTDKCICDDADATSRAFNALMGFHVMGSEPGVAARMSPWIGGGE